MIVGLICGPTGVGKSEIACEIALSNQFEIISADSRQLYKGMHIGTGNVSQAWQKKVPHHFLNVMEPTRVYSVHQYCQDVMTLVSEQPGKNFLVVGGTPLYIKSLLRYNTETRKAIPPAVRNEVKQIIKQKSPAEVHKQLSEWDPKVALKINPQDIFRLTKAMENYLYTGKSYLEYDFANTTAKEFLKIPLVCLNKNRSELYAKIDLRVESMFKAGWVSEVKELITGQDPHNLPCINALGYKEIVDYLGDKFPGQAEKDLIPIIQKKSRNYAKKQINFFKGQLSELIQLESAIFEKFLNTCNFNWPNFQKNLENRLTEEKQ